MLLRLKILRPVIAVSIDNQSLKTKTVGQSLSR
jgi:hypothetical protein